MILTLFREKTVEEVTMGKLHLNGEYFCDTLEEAVRTTETFLEDKTAIMEGSYRILMGQRTYNQSLVKTMNNDYIHYYRLQGKKEIVEYCKKLIYPRLDYADPLKATGYLIHHGNTVEHTEGCILVGNRTDGKSLKLKESRATFKTLFAKLVEADIAKQSIEIKINNAVEDKYAPPPIPKYEELICSVSAPERLVCSAFSEAPKTCTPFDRSSGTKPVVFR